MVLTILVVSLSACAISPVYARGTPTIYLSPSNYTFDTSNATIGTKFNVTVWVSNPTYPWKLMMWQGYLTYNHSVINTTSFFGESTETTSIRVWPNDNLEGRTWDNDYVFKGKAGGLIGNPFYYNLGSTSAIKVGDTLFSEVNVGSAKKLLTVEFEIKAFPSGGVNQLSTSLGINNADTFLYDAVGKIPDTDITKINGLVTIIPEFSPLMILPIFMVISLIAIAIAKKQFRAPRLVQRA